MKFSKEMGKALFETQIGVKKNTGDGTNLMSKRFNSELRTQPRDPEIVHLERQTKLLKDALRKAQKKG